MLVLIVHFDFLRREMGIDNVEKIPIPWVLRSGLWFFEWLGQCLFVTVLFCESDVGTCNDLMYNCSAGNGRKRQGLCFTQAELPSCGVGYIEYAVTNTTGEFLCEGLVVNDWWMDSWVIHSFHCSEQPFIYAVSALNPIDWLIIFFFIISVSASQFVDSNLHAHQVMLLSFFSGPLLAQRARLHLMRSM